MGEGGQIPFSHDGRERITGKTLKNVNPPETKEEERPEPSELRGRSLPPKIQKSKREGR